jgi:hypothetical protein
MFLSKEAYILPEYLAINFTNKKCVKKFDAEMLDFTVEFKNIQKYSSLKIRRQL